MGNTPCINLPIAGYGLAEIINSGSYIVIKIYYRSERYSSFYDGKYGWQSWITF